MGNTKGEASTRAEIGSFLGDAAGEVESLGHAKGMVEEGPRGV